MNLSRQTSIKTFSGNKDNDSLQTVKDRALQVQIVNKPKGGELLSCKPIVSQIREHGSEPVELIVRSSLIKLAASMYGAINESVQQQIEVIAEDLIEKYKYDSIEDIVEAIRKGRINYNNRYPNQYNRFNFQTIVGWLTTHLEEKSEAKEREEQNLKRQLLRDSETPLVDYKGFKKRVYKHRSRGLEEVKQAMDVFQKKRKIIHYYAQVVANNHITLSTSGGEDREQLVLLLEKYMFNIRFLGEEEQAKMIKQLESYDIFD